MQVLTFDFHNTIANCDPWFDLEIRHLPWAVVTHLGIPLHPSAQTQVERAYRQLRLDVIESGVEVDAYDAVERVLEEFGFAVPRREITSAVDALMRTAIEAMEPVPGAADTVRQVAMSGVPLGVVSSAVHHQTLVWIVERMGIADCFGQIVTSASSGYYKSTPAIYAAALDALGGTPGLSVHVGDSLRWDVATAQEAGMTAVWLETSRRDVHAADAPTTTPSLVLSSMEGAAAPLLDLLDRIRTPASV